MIPDFPKFSVTRRLPPIAQRFGDVDPANLLGA
jgi:hypothetical protein